MLLIKSYIKTWIRECKLKVIESKTEIILVKGNLRANVTYDFGSLDIEASTLVPDNCMKAWLQF